MYKIEKKTWWGDTRADVNSIFIIFRLAIDCDTASEWVAFVRKISRSFFGMFIVSGPKWGDGVCERMSLDVDLKEKKQHFNQISLNCFAPSEIQHLFWLNRPTSFGIRIRCRVEIQPVPGTWSSTSMLKTNRNWPHKIDAEYWSWFVSFPWLFVGYDPEYPYLLWHLVQTMSAIALQNPVKRSQCAISRCWWRRPLLCGCFQKKKFN